MLSKIFKIYSYLVGYKRAGKTVWFSLICSVFLVSFWCTGAEDILTPEERQWVQAKKTIRFAPDPFFKPFEYITADGRVEGITPEILRLISKRLQIEFEFVKLNTWSEVLNAIKKGEIDLLGTLTHTPEREQYLLFTSPYLNVPTALFARTKSPEYLDIHNLKGKRVGVVRDCGAHSWLVRNHPELKIVPVASPLEGRLMLSLGRLDAVVEVLPVGLVTLSDNSIPDIVRSTTELFIEPQHFAVSITNKMLRAIIEKGLSTIPQSEITALFAKHTEGFRLKQETIVPLWLKYTIAGLVALLIVASLSSITLNRLVKKRTKQLSDSEEQHRLILQDLTMGVCLVDRDGKIKFINKKLYEMTCLKSENVENIEGLFDKIVSDVAKCAQIKEIFQKFTRGSQTEGIANRPFELSITSLDGAEFIVEVMFDKLDDSFLITFYDITERRTYENRLKRSEEQFRNIFLYNQLPAVITSIEEGKFLEVNERFIEVTGYTREEVIGRAVFDINFWYNPQKREEFVELVKNNGVIRDYEAQVRTKTGEVLDLLVNSQIIQLQYGMALLSFGVDITERKKVEREQRRLNAIIDATSDIVATADADLNLFYLNNTGRKLLGLSDSDKLENVRLQRFYSIAIWKGTIENALKIASLSGIWSGETEIINSNGEKIPVSQVIIAHKKQDGSIDYYSTIIRDISRLKNVEEALRKSEEKLRQIIENSSQLFYAYDVNHKLTYISPQARQFFECESEEALVCWMDYLTDNPVNQIGIELTEAAIRTGKRQKPYELELKTKTGRTIWVEVNESPVVVNGKTVAIVGALTDITERKKVQKELAEKEHFIASVLQNTPDLILVYDLQKNSFVYANKNIYGLLGYPESETPLSFEEIIHPDDLPRFKEHLLKLKNAADEDVILFEYRVKKRTNEYLWYLARGSVFKRDANGEVVQILSVEQDITETKRALEEKQRLEMLLRQSQKIEAVGRLAAGVAHEVNNSLTVISGNAELLMDSENLTNNEKDQIASIIQSVNKCSDITRRLLVFSRQQPLNPKPVNLNNIVSNFQKMVQRLIGEHITMQINLAENVPLINADNSMIEQVLLNLSLNARDAMPKGGVLTISTSTAEFDSTNLPPNPDASTGRFVMLTVTDNGCGMDEATKARIFDPFFTTKELGKGTGLGMCVVYGIVRQHGGWIDFDSEVGKGTTFRIYFPVVAELVETKETKPSKETLSTAPAGNETILVVEDDEQVSSLVTMCLKRCGYRVITARNAAQAMRIWNELNGKIDLVFTDIIMPGGMSGIDLVGKLREKNPDLKAMYTSGYSSELLVFQPDLIEEGAFIAKPFDPIDLAKKIRDFLSRK